MSRRSADRGAPARLELSSFGVCRGELVVIENLSLSVPAGQCVGIVGPNGSGKTSLVESLAGLIPATGLLRLDGTPIRIGNPAEALRSGIALCPSNRGIFARMTVVENLLVGAQVVPRRHRRGRVEEQLEQFPALRRRANLRAGQLSGGERQQLAIARALTVRPKLLLLDEPSRGLSPAAIEDLFVVLSALVSAGVSVMIVDQAIDWMFGRLDCMMVMTNGRIQAVVGQDDGSENELIDQYFDLR